MAILIIATTDKEKQYQADAAVLPNGRILLSPDAMDGMGDILSSQIERDKEQIDDHTGKSATGDELLTALSSRWSNMIVQSRIFSDDEVDEVKKYVKESRMKNA